MEAAAHDALGLTGATELGSQRRPAIELDALLAKRAKFKRAHQLVLLRVGGAGSDTSYERAATAGGSGRRWTDLDSAARPGGRPSWPATWWPPSTGSRGGRPTAPPGTGRSGSAGAGRPPATGSPSSGSRDPELEKRYVGQERGRLPAAGRPQPGRPTCGAGPTGRHRTTGRPDSRPALMTAAQARDRTPAPVR